MNSFYVLLVVAFSCGALFKLGDALADLVIELVKLIIAVIRGRIR